MAYLAPVEVTEPVAGTTAGVWKFARPVRAISVDNQSGKDFESARVKLMAGDVSKIRREGEDRNDVSVEAKKWASARDSRQPSSRLAWFLRSV